MTKDEQRAIFLQQIRAKPRSSGVGAAIGWLIVFAATMVAVFYIALGIKEAVPVVRDWLHPPAKCYLLNYEVKCPT